MQWGEAGCLTLIKWMQLLFALLNDFPCGYRMVCPCQTALLLRGRESKPQNKHRGRRRRQRRSRTAGAPHFIVHREVRNVGLDLKDLFCPPEAFKQLTVSPIQWQAGMRDQGNQFCWIASRELPGWIQFVWGNNSDLWPYRKPQPSVQSLLDSKNLLRSLTQVYWKVKGMRYSWRVSKISQHENAL